MEKKLLGLAVSALLLNASCGKKKSDSKDFAIPTVDFLLPTPADTALTTAENGPLSDWNGRVNLEIDHLKKDIDIVSAAAAGLEKEAKEDSFKFSGKGPKGNLSGQFQEISEDGYNNKATVCVDNKLFMTVRWSNDGLKILSTRDMNNTPNIANATDRKVKTAYTKGTDTQVDIQYYGKPAAFPLGADGGYLSAFATAKKLSTGDFTISTVDDWSATKDSTWTSADGYLLGKMDSTGKGKYVGYAKRLRTAVSPAICTTNFVEASPVFCTGRDTPSGTKYTTALLASTYTELKNAGLKLIQASSLSAIVLDGSCP